MSADTVQRACMAVILACVLAACAGVKAPDWVTENRAAAYPADQFIIGVGQADAKPAAEERAYAAISRVFKADVTSQTQDIESYTSREGRGSPQTERRLMLDTTTKVSTDKVLENVTVAETWQHPKTGLYSALAVMHRGTARKALQGRIVELDEAIERDLASSRSEDKLLALRGLRRAARALSVRTAINNDLRIIGGQGMESSYSVSGLNADLERFLRERLRISLEVRGDHVEAVTRAILEGLTREGFPMTAENVTPTTRVPANADLLVKGETHTWPLNLPDPQFRYVRWCADFMVVNPGTRQVIGGTTRSGREGHLSYREASERAVRMLQQEITAGLAKNLADQIYADPHDDAIPAACPQTLPGP